MGLTAVEGGTRLRPRARAGIRRRHYRRERSRFWTGFFVVLCSGLLIGGGTSLAALLAAGPLFLNLPSPSRLASEPLAADTIIYASDGTTQLADIHAGGHQRYEIRLSQMGTLVPAATVAVEDSNFYSNPGIDPNAMIRAALVNLTQHRSVQGASTITQQLVKLRLLDSSPTIERKVKEALLAYQIDRSYPKDLILEMYLNTVFYGNDSYGIEAAALNYYHRHASELDLAQAAMLAGIPQNPSYNNPWVNWAGAKARQRMVLDAMVRTGRILPAQADAAYAEDLSPPDHMFRPQNHVLAPNFVDYVKAELAGRYGADAVATSGFRVVTTMDAGLQALAQKAVTDNVNAQRGRDLSQGALVAIDPRSGAILAMVGSAHPEDSDPRHCGQCDMATQQLNPGSTIKMITYTAAIESGRYTMVTPILDTPLSVRRPGDPDTYQPKNYDLRYHGVCELQRCLGNSLNVPAVKVELGVGVGSVVQLARRMGAPPRICQEKPDHTRECSEPDPDAYPVSMTLGSVAETPLQMATATSVLAAQGMLHPPYAIAEIRDRSGQVIFRADPQAGARQVLDPKVAFITQQMLSDDSNRAMIFGRGSALTLEGRRVAAKTGTSDGFRDAWTVGFTPSLAVATWFGNPDNSPMKRDQEGQDADGLYVAAPAWHAFMQSALDRLGKGDEWYQPPAGLSTEWWAGRKVYLMPGTVPWQLAPRLPDWAQESRPAPSPSPSPQASPSASPRPGSRVPRG